MAAMQLTLSLVLMVAEYNEADETTQRSCFEGGGLGVTALTVQRIPPTLWRRR